MKQILLIVAALSLAGCVGTRNAEGEYLSIARGQVPIKSLAPFTACTNEVLQDMQYGASVFFNRQTKRERGIRIDLNSPVVGTILSADIFDNGDVELFEWKRAKFIPTDAQLQGFKKCLSQYKA